MIRKSAFFFVLFCLTVFGVQAENEKSEKIEKNVNIPKNESKQIAAITTEFGEIKIQLELEKAPKSAGDFKKYVEEGLYDDQGFYRVVRADNDQGAPLIDVVQGGLLDETKALAPVDHETTKQSGLKHIRGAVSLARGDVGTGSAAYFFIVVKDSPGLDFGGLRNPDKQGFAVFGFVTHGMGIIDKIYQTDPKALKGDGYMKGQILIDTVKIKNVSLQ